MSSKALKPLRRFRLYPEAQGGLYVLVNVWPTLQALRDYGETLALSRRLQCTGFCTSFELERYRRGRWRLTQCFAEVNLAKGSLSIGLIAHEFGHAAFAWARRMLGSLRCLDIKRPRLVSEEEERLCYAHGRLCDEFERRATAAGLYRDAELIGAR